MRPEGVAPLARCVPGDRRRGGAHFLRAAKSRIHCRGAAEDVNEIGRRMVELGRADRRDVWVDSDVPGAEWTGYASLAYFPFAPTTPHFLRIPPDLHSVDLVREVF